MTVIEIYTARTADATDPSATHIEAAGGELSPLANTIIDRAIDGMTRKLIAGARNRNNSRPNAKTTDLASDAKDAMKAVSSQSVMDVASRGAAWKELIQKSLTHGINSLGTMQFDGSFTVKNGVAEGLKEVPNSPGVYVVFNKQGKPVYVGDSGKIQARWHAGHLNSHRQDQKQGKEYKLHSELEEGCTVRYIMTESTATAAAIEAHLIKTVKAQEESQDVDDPDRLKNKRHELLDEQGKRDNIEAKKMKDSSGSTSSLVKGAGIQGAIHGGFVVLEQLTAAVIKAVKDELVDMVIGATRSIKKRLHRFFKKVWDAVLKIVTAPFKLLAGIFEFIVNAVSKTMAQFYQLARNICDLGHAAIQLYKGSQTMSTEELVAKISETILLSGTAILWDALDPVLEPQLAALVGPVAPYLSVAVCAIGFGLSSFCLQKLVPSLVRFLVVAASGAQELLAEQRQACLKLIEVYEGQLRLLDALGDAANESLTFERETRVHVETLKTHRAVARRDLTALLA